jgi:hypothetical protein
MKKFPLSVQARRALRGEFAPTGQQVCCGRFFATLRPRFGAGAVRSIYRFEFGVVMQQSGGAAGEVRA